MNDNRVFDCKAIIFDLDGVLVDSSAVVERHWREWADRNGIDMAVIDPIMHGRRAVETMQLVAPHLDIEKEAARFAAIEAAETEGLVSIDGAMSLLSSLPPGVWGVATSGTRAIARARLEAVGLPIPAVLVTADDVQRGKPAPDVYLMAAEQLGAAPEGCMVFEDAPAGVEAAISAGMRVVGVKTSYNGDELIGVEMVIQGLDAVQYEDNQLMVQQII